METLDLSPRSDWVADGGLGLGQAEETEEKEEKTEKAEMEEKKEPEEHKDIVTWSKLRDELQEMVIARLPFVKLFQAPLLSRAWRANFRCQAFRDDVTTVSHRWPIYGPVHLSREGLVGYNAAAQRWEKLFTLSYLPYVPYGDEGWSTYSGAGSLICFARRNKRRDREAFRIKQRTSPLVLAEKMLRGWHGRRPPGADAKFQDFRCRFEEFCMADTVDSKPSKATEDLHWYIETSLDHLSPYNLGVGAAFDMYVTNVVTKEWKELPTRPCMNRPDIVQLVAVGTSAYKLILMTLQPQGSSRPFLIQIYDLKTDSWESKDTTAELCSFEINLVKTFVYFDGALFILVVGAGENENEVLHEILAYNIESDSWTTIPHPVLFGIQNLPICGLVVCRSDVMLVSGTKNVDSPGPVALEHSGSTRLVINRLEIECMNFSFFSEGPSLGDVENVGDVDLAIIGAGDCLYLALRCEPGKPCMMFNIRQKVWSTLAPANRSFLPTICRTAKFPFQPGLNPFVKLRTPPGRSALDAGGRAEPPPDAGEADGSADRRPLTDSQDVD